MTGRRGRTLEVRVNPDDLGKVIGRNGRTAKALRTVIGPTIMSSFKCSALGNSVMLGGLT